MDEEMRELRALIKQNIALTEDVAHQVRKMRRAAMWGRFFQVVWWAGVITVSGAAYYYYFEPYLEKALQIYSQVEGSTQQTPSLNQEVQQFFQNLNKPK